jgi:glucose/arabinose dehydrogenase
MNRFPSTLALAVIAAGACHPADPPVTEPPDPPDVYIPPGGHFCDLPGAVKQTAAGVVVVPGGAKDLAWLKLPVGFCAHDYGHVGNARQIRFAPGGELFVASPTAPTTGGGGGGRQAIVLLPDDDNDGLGDAAISFLTGLPSTQGMMFANGHFYYQDGSKILRIPYAKGDRAPSGSSEMVAQFTVYSSPIHWPKTLDQADDGTIYATNGSDQDEVCDPSRPFRGGVLQIDGAAGGTPVAKGFRNPIGVRCERGHNLCFAVELSKDYSTTEGGREKLVPIRQGDDWGFPCCATTGVPYDVLPTPDCSAVTSENVSFVIGDTPFDVDFAPATWPAPYTGSAFVPLHGVVGTWTGARLVAIEIDPVTGLPKSATDTPTGGSRDAMSDFATGWDDGNRAHGRPANVAFAADGRLFLGNDNSGDIIWMAPLDLPR